MNDIPATARIIAELSERITAPARAVAAIVESIHRNRYHPPEFIND